VNPEVTFQDLSHDGGFPLQRLAVGTWLSPIPLESTATSGETRQVGESDLSVTVYTPGVNAIHSPPQDDQTLGHRPCR